MLTFRMWFSFSLLLSFTNFSSYFCYHLRTEESHPLYFKGQGRTVLITGPFCQWVKTGQAFSVWLPIEEEAVVTKYTYIPNIFLFHLRNNILLGAEMDQQGQRQVLHFEYQCLYSPHYLGLRNDLLRNRCQGQI